MHCTWHRWEEDGPGEVLRQQHKEHDANRPHIPSHIGNRDLLQELNTNNDQFTNIEARRKLWLLMCLMVPVGELLQLAVRLCHPKVTDTGSTIKNQAANSWD